MVQDLQVNGNLTFGAPLGGSSSAAVCVNALNQIIVLGSGNCFPSLSPSGGAIAGSVSISATGGWSSSNFGKQLLLTTPNGASNPALGFTDSTGLNLWALANNNGHTLGIYKMPAYTDNTDPPQAVATFSDGSGNNIAGMQVNLNLTAQPPGAVWAGTLTSKVALGYQLASPSTVYSVLSVVSDNGDASHIGTNVSAPAGEFDYQDSAIDANSGQGGGGAFGFGTHQTCIKSNPPGGLPWGAALKNCEVEWNLMYGPNNQWASMNGVEVLQEHDYNVNGMDDVGNRPAQELIFGTKTPVASGGWPAFTSQGYLISGEGSDESNGYNYLGNDVAIGGHIAHAAIDLEQTTSYSPKITSATPGSPTYSVTVDNVLPLAAGNQGAAGPNGPGITYVAAKTKTTTAAVAGSATVPLSDTFYLRQLMLVYDLTTPSAIPAGAYITSIAGSSVVLTSNVTIPNGDVLLFASGIKRVTINGDAYTVAGIIDTAAGSPAGTVYFTSPVSVADATNGATIVPDTHSIWLCNGSANAPWCDIAFDSWGTNTLRADGAGGAVFTGKKLTSNGGFATPVVTNTTPNVGALNSLISTFNETGGTPGDVNAGLRDQCNVNGNPGDYVWCENVVLNNAATSGQHVASAAAAFKTGNSATWGRLTQAVDEMGGSSSADGSLVGHELDLSANGADDFGNGIRVALDIVGSKYGTGAAATFGYGVRLNAGAGNAFLRGLTLNGTYNVAGIDLSGATLGTGAVGLQLAATQPIAFDASNQLLTSGGGALVYQHNGSALFEQLANGNFVVTNGPLTVQQSGSTASASLTSTVNSGTIGELSFMGQDSTGTVVDYGDLTGSVVSNTHGATVGALDMPVITPTSGTVPLMASSRAQNVMTVDDWGAKGDCTTDDSAAFNAYAAWVRGSTGYQAQRTIRLSPNKCYLVRSSINWGAFSPYYVTVQGNGATIVGNVGATHAIINAMDSGITINNLRVVTQGSALYGIQFGNTIVGGAGDLPIRMDNVYVIGTFVNSSMLNQGDETSLFNGIHLINQTPGGYALIEDGMVHWAIDPTYQAQAIPANSQQSFNENTFINSTFVNSASTGTSPAVWMANFGQHEYIDSYANVGSASPVAVIYSAFPNSNNGLLWDVHSESAPSTEFLITGTYATPTITGLRYDNQLEQVAASGPIFTLDTGITSATLNDLSFNVLRLLNGGVTLFDQPAKYVGTVEGYLPPGVWNAAANSFLGCVTSTTKVCTGTTLALSGAASFGGGSVTAGSDTPNGSLVVGNIGTSGTPYINFYGCGVAGNYCARLIADASGQFHFFGAGGAAPTIATASGGVVHAYQGTVRTEMLQGSGSSPAVSACGTGAIIDGAATNLAGTVTEGTTATGCTITWNGAGNQYTAAPHCVISSPNGAPFTSYSTSTTALTIVNASASGNQFTYLCAQ